MNVAAAEQNIARIDGDDRPLRAERGEKLDSAPVGRFVSVAEHGQDQSTVDKQKVNIRGSQPFARFACVLARLKDIRFALLLRYADGLIWNGQLMDSETRASVCIRR